MFDKLKLIIEFPLFLWYVIIRQCFVITLGKVDLSNVQAGMSFCFLEKGKKSEKYEIFYIGFNNRVYYKPVAKR